MMTPPNTPNTEPLTQPLPALREDLTYTVHQQQNDLWYAVQDPLTGKFLRLGRREYLLAMAMNGHRNGAEVIANLHELAPHLTASEADVQQLATWLAKAGMLQLGAPPAATPSHRKVVFNLLYTRIPLLSGQLLERVAGFFVPVMNRFVVALIALTCLWAAGSVLLNWEEFTRRASKLFVADGRLWWLAAWLVLKTAHELGHAVIAVKVGSQIRAAGISLIMLAPVPYVDISDLWTISNRWQRILCSAGGMLVELAIAAVAAIVALQTSNESLQYFCCALATTGTVTTLAFNANPLVRFDGYFIASDLLDRPNLWTDGQVAVKRLLSRILKPFSPPTGTIHWVMALYGLGCYQYRIAMLLTLAVWTILVFQGVGIILVMWGAYAMVAAPWMKARAAAKQQRATSGPAASSPGTSLPWFANENMWGLGIATVLIAITLALPSPVQPSAPGVVSFRDPVTLRAETEGFLERLLVPVGQSVHQGQVIAQLNNPQLELELVLKAIEVNCQEESIQAKRARGELAELQSHEAQLASLRTQLAQLVEKSERLDVRAPVAGTLIQHDLCRQLGQFISPGAALGLIATPEVIEVSVSASQQEVEPMRACLGTTVQLTLADGSRGTGQIEKVEPRGSEVLVQPQLAALYGGPITVEIERSESGEETLRLPSPRFDVRIRIDATQYSANPNVWVPGQAVWVRVPSSSASVWTIIQRWLEKKWNSLEQQAQQG